MSTTTYARAWMIRRKDGVTLGFTDHDQVLSFEAVDFRPQFGMSARALVQSLGLSVDNSEAEGALADDGITERDIMAGRWDGAELKLWEVDWTDPQTRRLSFAGYLGEVTRSSGAFRAELRGVAEALNEARGRVFHPRCSAQLGDTACGIDTLQSAYSCDLALQGLEEARRLSFADFPDFAMGWFNRGSLVVLSGEAKGLSSAIRSDLTGVQGRREVELWQALPIVPVAGDRIRLVAGCDKRGATCREKFANYANFRGFPHVPSEDWLIAPQVGG